jgi:transposase
LIQTYTICQIKGHELTCAVTEGNMARKLQIEWQEEAETLGILYRTEKDTQNRQRLHALWLMRQGKAMTETAEILGVHVRTVQEWVSWYRQGGIAALLPHRHGGRRSRSRRLSDAQEAELKQKANAGEIHRIEEGVQWAQAAHQVAYTYWGMRHVFARLGLRQKVPRPRNPKASETEQALWKKGG